LPIFKVRGPVPPAFGSVDVITDPGGEADKARLFKALGGEGGNERRGRNSGTREGENDGRCVLCESEKQHCWRIRAQRGLGGAISALLKGDSD
jgi:hypothetical protein